MEKNVASKSDFVTDRKRKDRKPIHDNSESSTKRCIAVHGDSIIKEIKGHLLTTKKTESCGEILSWGIHKSNVSLYVKPTLEMNPDCVILHCGTNDLKNFDQDGC